MGYKSQAICTLWWVKDCFQLRSIDNSENDAEGFFDEVMHIPVKIFRVCLFETFNFLSSRKYSGNYE
jgi:hypothetical protein